VGEQYLDLFCAGAYALCSKLMLGLSAVSMNWLFFVLATVGIIYSIYQSLLGIGQHFWIRHLVCVAIASLMVSVPIAIPLNQLDYAAPGKIEALMNTSIGGAPILTWVTDQFFRSLNRSVRIILSGGVPTVGIPGIVAQSDELMANPRILNDVQLRANLIAWKSYVLPRLLQQDPRLMNAITLNHWQTLAQNPKSSDVRFNADAQNVQNFVQMLNAISLDIVEAQQTTQVMINTSARRLGATPITADPDTGNLHIQLLTASTFAINPAVASTNSDYQTVQNTGLNLTKTMI